MFKLMTDNDRAYHAGASNQALIIEDEDFPVVIVIDGTRVEVYWVDDELDTFNYYNISPSARSVGEMVVDWVKGMMWRGKSASEVQTELKQMLLHLGFFKV